MELGLQMRRFNLPNLHKCCLGTVIAKIRPPSLRECRDHVYWSLRMWPVMREREEQKWLHQLVTPRIQKKGQIVDFCMLQVLNHAGHPQSIDGTTYRRCGLWLACLAIVWGPRPTARPTDHRSNHGPWFEAQNLSLWWPNDGPPGRTVSQTMVHQLGSVGGQLRW